MRTFMDAGGVQRLEEYFRRIGDVLGEERRRGSFAIYAMGLLGDGERKSVEPIAARACPDPSKTDAMHQRLLHFAVDSRWSDREVRREAARYALDAMTQREPVEAWIIDDTGFLKQGKHSVGVQRQYTGSAGKITNCQIGVSLSIATRTEHLPIDFELYLPESWANDSVRRQEARIPEDVLFKTKPQLAVQMIGRAVADGVPKGVVLADSAYGSSSDFRAQVRSLGLHYAVGVDPQTTVSLLDNQGHPHDEAVSVKDMALSIHERGGFRRCTWRSGTREELRAHFALRRVVAAGEPKGQQEPLWLLIEWRENEPEPANYFLISVPDRTATKQLIRLVMQRWRTERVYEDLKGELGLDHYEGRRFPGWHHHVSVALCCYAFIIAERVRHFPPSARGADEAHAQPLQA
ncbi:IS701 family transposase [Cystobacter fuscus]|uniref:IS701 family transposase n=1 Tax=Cystobacter fuscus TaxID=43 RepID=UPI0037BF7F22